MSGTTDRYGMNFHHIKHDILCVFLLIRVECLIAPFPMLCRKVTITGSQGAIRAAESMIRQRVAYASEN